MSSPRIASHTRHNLASNLGPSVENRTTPCILGEGDEVSVDIIIVSQFTKLFCNDSDSLLNFRIIFSKISGHGWKCELPSIFEWGFYVILQA